MEATLVEVFLTMLEGLLPELGTNAATSAIDKILTALITLVPIIAANFANFLTPVKNIIAALSASGNITPDQLTQLAALDAQVDAAFDASAATP